MSILLLLGEQGTPGGTTPTVTTDDPVKYIEKDKALAGGNVTSDGGATVTDRGIVLYDLSNTRSLDLERDSSQHLLNTSPVELGSLGDITLECYVKVESLADYLFLMILAGDTESEADNSNYLLYIDVDGKLNWLHEYGNGSNELVTTVSTTISTGTWTHIAAVRDSTNKNILFYVNGILQETLSYSNQATGGSTPKFAIGGGVGGLNTFDGLIDEVRIWNRMRTGAELAGNYQRQLVGGEAGLIGYWKLNGDYKDSSRKGNEMTPVNTPKFSTTVPFNGPTTTYSVEGTTGAFTKQLTGLSPNTDYQVKAYATNVNGTAYGSAVSFTTRELNLQKSYFYKIYNTDGTYNTTWSEDVVSEPSFRTVINGGAGVLNVRLARKFDDFGEDDDVALNNTVKMYVIDKENPNGLLLYAGYISGYRPVVRETQEYVEITVFGFVAELNRIILKDSGGDTTLTYNSYDPATILKDVIDKYRALGGSLNYTSDSIVLTNTVVSYTFNTNTVKEAFDKIIELCPDGWYYRIDPDGTVYLQPRHDTADHTFTLGLDIKNLETFRRIEDVVNAVYFTGGGDPPLFRLYENTGSRGTYGRYEVKKVDQRVTTIATAQTISDRILDARNAAEIRSIFTIIDSNGPGTRGYDLETVKVGQTLKVKNLKAGVKTVTYWDQAEWDTDVWDQTTATSAADVIQILSIIYKPDTIEIEASSRLPEIAKRVEDINRNLEDTQTKDNPSAPS